MTRISIVTPSFNQGRFLSEAMESVRLQSHPDVEHLILDGASNDGTIALLRGLDGKDEWSHVRWLSRADGGQSAALNKGFRLASGDIVGWLNSDDRYRPGCFDQVVKAFDQNPEVDIFYGDYTLMDEDGTIQCVRREIEFNPFILLYHRVLYIPTTATFFRQRVFEEGHLLKEDLHYAMDYEFFLRLTAADYCIQHIPCVLADFRVHPQSKSSRGTQLQSAEKRCTMELFSPVTRNFGSPRLRNLTFITLQIVAGLLRWSEKMLRGYYFVQHRHGHLGASNGFIR
jgi:glycosyltransferase involved in cell wall biosynthesis